MLTLPFKFAIGGKEAEGTPALRAGVRPASPPRVGVCAVARTWDAGGADYASDQLRPCTESGQQDVGVDDFSDPH